MARAFDAREKTQVHETLLQSGITLFGRFGFSRTTIDAIVADAGIAKGTFYNFWDSKEAFFFACLNETEDLYRAEVIEPLLTSGRPPAQILGSLISETMKAADSYPIITQALDPVLISRLFRKLPPEIIERHQMKDRGEFSLITASWNSEEFDPGIPPEILDGLFKGILMMSLHKTVIGEDIFPQVMETTARLLSAGFESLSDRNIRRRRHGRKHS